MSARGICGAQGNAGQALARAQPGSEGYYYGTGCQGWAAGPRSTRVLNVRGNTGSGLFKKLAEIREEGRGKQKHGLQLGLSSYEFFSKMPPDH